MCQDESIYTNPDKFLPERFSSEYRSQSARSEEDSTNIVFGFGRRKCPGQFMIDASLWIALASMIAAFDVRKAKDAFGNEVEPEVVYDNSVFSTMKPFRYEIAPRNAQAVRVIREARGLED